MHLVAQPTKIEVTADPFGPPLRRRHASLRPSDVPTPWHVVASVALRRLNARAAEISLHLDTALALVFERELLLVDLADACPVKDVLGALDHAAARISVRSRLPGADAVYLRSLTCGADVAGKRLVIPRVGSELCVSLPARLSARLLAAGGPNRLAVRDDLAAAVGLEVAAVCAGQTMSEWAARALLDVY